MKVRGIELSLLQRCGAHLDSETDAEEALLVSSAAVQAAVDGFTDKMVAFRCTRGEEGYRCETVLEPLDIVANFEKKVPREWINEAGNGVNQQFIDYVLPLIQGDAKAPRVNGLPLLCPAEEGPDHRAVRFLPSLNIQKLRPAPLNGAGRSFCMLGSFIPSDPGPFRKAVRSDPGTAQSPGAARVFSGRGAPGG